MRLSSLLLIIVFGLFLITGLGQEPAGQNKSVTPPGNVQLLDGYVLEIGAGKDAVTGNIRSRDGFAIHFVHSAVKGFYAKHFGDKAGISWTKHQKVNGRQLDLASLKSGEVVALFDHTTKFSAKPTSFAQLTDFLLTVMTYNSEEATPASPSSSVPGNIKLLEGYVYERRRGIDSNVGALVRSDKFTIGHDIGKMAANYAFQYFPENVERLRRQSHLNSDAIEREVLYLQNKIEWRQRQKVNGHDVMVVLLKDSTLIAAFTDFSANFISKVDSNDKIADFFLTVLTYQPDLGKKH